MSNKHLYILTTVVLSFVSFLSGYLLIQFRLDGQLTANIERGETIQGFKIQTAASQKNDIEIEDEIKKVTLLESEPVVAAVNASDSNSVIYYHKNSGQVSQVNLKTGDKEVVSDGILKNFLDTIWSSSRAEVISSFFTGSGKEYRYFNYQTKENTPLNKNVQAVAFSPDGQYLTRFELGKDRNEISVSNPDGTVKKVVLPTRFSDVELDWPLEEKISVSSRDFDNNDSLYLLSLDGELDLILPAAVGLEYKWSPDGKKLIYSHQSEPGKNTFAVFSDNQHKILPTGIEARSCAWNSNNVSVICVVRDGTTGMNNLIEINTLSGESKTKVEDIGITAKEIFISRLEDYAIITSPEGSLYGVHF